ncbi:putative uncharacterized protein [Pseudomonas sp. StFLB209]|uniref:energy transducer TonB n=1 Tax=Pseudomonas sp. StFLB209 TaxID=1028989 RepID=UPI0004F9222B|nr:hypothetical protein [Pseudomonas sp. StFLB209]BAP42155.1 putative uncharacterized protein [Pseudomonas sp. StFLB209]
MPGKMIVCIFVMVAGLLANQVMAANSWPVPLHMPDFERPQSLRDAPWPAQISVRILVRRDGSVQFVEVVEGTDPEFIAIARKAVEQWRFQSWTPPASSPEGEVIRVTVNYGETEGQRQSLAHNVKLKKVLCHQLNEQVRKRNAWWLPRRSSDPSVFEQTERYLSHDPMIRTYLSDAQRQDLVVALLEARADIIARCKSNPASRYVDQLPEKVREAI